MSDVPASSRKTVAVDLDGVLARYEQWEGPDAIGDPIPGALDFMHLLAMEFELVVFTTRCASEIIYEARRRRRLVEAWLEENRIPFDYVYEGPGKPMAVAYVDDRAVECDPQRDERAFEAAIIKVRALNAR